MQNFQLTNLLNFYSKLKQTNKLCLSQHFLNFLKKGILEMYFGKSCCNQQMRPSNIIQRVSSSSHPLLKAFTALFTSLFSPWTWPWDPMHQDCGSIFFPREVDVIYLLLIFAYIILSAITYYQINSYSLSFFFKLSLPLRKLHITSLITHYQIFMQCHS